MWYKIRYHLSLPENSTRCNKSANENSWQYQTVSTFYSRTLQTTHATENDCSIQKMSSMTMKTGSELRFEAGSWQEAAHDIYIGLLVGLGHVFKIFVQMPYNYLLGTAIPPPLRESGTLKVVGVGFGRTGTVSGCCAACCCPSLPGIKEFCPCYFFSSQCADGGCSFVSDPPLDPRTNCTVLGQVSVGRAGDADSAHSTLVRKLK